MTDLKGREWCKSCERRLANLRADGALEFLVPAVNYYGANYHVACWDRVWRAAVEQKP